MADILQFNKNIDDNSNTKKNVNVIRLVTGEELIGFLSYDGEEEVYTITHPLRIILQPSPDGMNFVVHLMDYMPYVKDTVFLFGEEHVMNICDPADGLEKQFRSRFSNIVLPEKPKIIV